MVMKPRFSQARFPLTSTPSGVKTNACNTIANSSPSQATLLDQNRTGSRDATNMIGIPITANKP